MVCPWSGERIIVLASISVSDVCWDIFPWWSRSGPYCDGGAELPATLVGVRLQRRLSSGVWNFGFKFEYRCDSTQQYPPLGRCMVTAVWNLLVPAPDGLATCCVSEVARRVPMTTKTAYLLPVIRNGATAEV